MVTYIAGDNLQAMDEVIEPPAVKAIWPRGTADLVLRDDIAMPATRQGLCREHDPVTLGAAAPCRGLDGKAFPDRTAPRTAAGQVNRHGSRRGAHAENV